MMSLVGGQAGRDQLPWVQSGGTALGEHQEMLSWGGCHILAGGRAVKNKQGDKWQEEGATSRVPTALPGEGGAALR